MRSLPLLSKAWKKNFVLPFKKRHRPLLGAMPVPIWLSLIHILYFSPQLTSMVVISVLWIVLYNANPNTGLINSILTSLGMDPIKFLSDADTAMNSIIFMSAWQGAGYQMMIFLAGLQGIPKDQYEAASVDGANKFKQFLYITIPGLKGTIKYVIMITMIPVSYTHLTLSQRIETPKMISSMAMIFLYFRTK